MRLDKEQMLSCTLQTVVHAHAGDWMGMPIEFVCPMKDSCSLVLLAHDMLVDQVGRHGMQEMVVGRLEELEGVEEQIGLGVHRELVVHKRPNILQEEVEHGSKQAKE